MLCLNRIFEEIVDEISDKYELTEEKIVVRKQESWLVVASVLLDGVEDEILNIKFKTENTITIGGFLTEIR